MTDDDEPPARSPLHPVISTTITLKDVPPDRGFVIGFFGREFWIFEDDDGVWHKKEIVQ